MQSGPIRRETITFDHKPIAIIAGHGSDPFSIVRMTVPPDAGVVSHQSLDEDKLFLVLSGSLRSERREAQNPGGGSKPPTTSASRRAKSIGVRSSR